jgi:hypothetical protein
MAIEAADRARVLKRVTEQLNLCDPGTYSSTLSTRNKTRNAAAIADFVDEAGLMILKVLARCQNEFRYLFVTDTAAITTSGDLLPLIGGQPHVGPPVSVRITLSSGGIVRDGVQRDYRQIQRMRETPANYDPNGTAHNLAGSVLGGYYDIVNDKFHFTGYSAVLALARHPQRTETATLVPGQFENTWVHLGIGEAAKVGTGGYQDSVIGNYGKLGFDELTQFEAQHTMPAVQP